MNLVTKWLLETYLGSDRFTPLKQNWLDWVDHIKRGAKCVVLLEHWA